MGPKQLTVSASLLLCDRWPKVIEFPEFYRCNQWWQMAIQGPIFIFRCKNWVAMQFLRYWLLLRYYSSHWSEVGINIDSGKEVTGTGRLQARNTWAIFALSSLMFSLLPRKTIDFKSFSVIRKVGHCTLFLLYCVRQRSSFVQRLLSTIPIFQDDFCR